MAGLVGIAFELFSKMVEKGMEQKEESELEICRQTLRRYKEAYRKLREEYIDQKKHSDQIIACHEGTIEQLRRQAIQLTKSNADLMQRLTVAYVKETTGGVASMEEYDAAMAEDSGEPEDPNQ